MTPDSSPTPTPAKTGLPLFKGEVKKKRVLFPASLQPKKDGRELPGLAMLRQSNVSKGTLSDRIIERFMKFKMSDLMLVSAGVAVLLVAPLAERLILDLAEGGRAGIMSNDKAMIGSPFGGTLLDMMVNGAIRRLRGLTGRGGFGKDGIEGVYGEGAGDGSASLGGKGRGWGDAISPAEAAALEAARKARLPKPTDALMGKLSEMAVREKDPTTKASSSALAALSSKGLVKDPSVESNLSRLSASKDYRGMDKGSSKGMDRPKLELMSSMGVANSGGKTSANISGGSVLTNSNDKVDPQIQKLHDINAKWQKIIEADNAVITGLASTINAAPSTMALFAPVNALKPAYAKLEADQAAHLQEVADWTKFVQQRLPGSPNGLNDATTKGVMRSAMQGRSAAHNAARAGGQRHHGLSGHERGQGRTPHHKGDAGGAAQGPAGK